MNDPKDMMPDHDLHLERVQDLIEEDGIYDYGYDADEHHQYDPYRDCPNSPYYEDR